MPVLLATSAFFIGAETALFGLSARQRLDMDQRRAGYGAALTLLQKPRMLLITLLLGNMLANVLYFVVGSVLAWSQPWGAPGAALIPLAALLAIVLLGEVAPKMLASAHGPSIARIVAPPLLVLHNLILPVRMVIDRLIVRPLSHLATPSKGTAGLSLRELDALIEVSGEDGLVDAHEQQLLADVLMLGQRHLSDVMTPRTRMVSIPIDADTKAVNELIFTHRLMRLPVHGRDLDDILGFLHVKDWLRGSGDLSAMLRSPIYLPEVTSVDRAMASLRARRGQTAIVVDEFGGTAGIVSLHDLIEPLVGDIADDTAHRAEEARPMGPGRWMIPGGFPAERLTRALSGPATHLEHAVTVAGLVTRRLNRMPAQGDKVSIGNVTIEVNHVNDAGRVESLIVSAHEAGR